MTRVVAREASVASTNADTVLCKPTEKLVEYCVKRLIWNVYATKTMSEANSHAARTAMTPDSIMLRLLTTIDRAISSSGMEREARLTHVNLPDKQGLSCNDRYGSENSSHFQRAI